MELSIAADGNGTLRVLSSYHVTHITVPHVHIRNVRVVCVDELGHQISDVDNNVFLLEFKFFFEI